MIVTRQMNNIERGYEQLRFEDTERQILRHLIYTIENLDLTRINDPDLCYSLMARLGGNMLVWLPQEVGYLELNDRMCLKRPTVDDDSETWTLDDVVDYLDSFDAPPYPGKGGFTPGGL